MSPSDFLVTALELDGNDLGPLINYTKEKLYDEAEKHFNRRVLSKFFTFFPIGFIFQVLTRTAVRFRIVT
jgi:hypothetical protein